MDHITTRSGKSLLSHDDPQSSFTPRSKKLRKHTERFLVGQPIPSISGTQLPTTRQVLQRLFYAKDCVRGKRNADNNSACRETVKEVLEIWEKANIKTLSVFRCYVKLNNVFSEWRRLNKNSLRGSNEQTQKFEEELEKLWGVGSEDAIGDIRKNRLEIA